MEKRWEQYADSVEQGDILLFQPWWEKPENAFVQLLYREAAIRRGGGLRALAGADTATLMAQAEPRPTKRVMPRPRRWASWARPPRWPP